jgi:hypothetical protein
VNQLPDVPGDRLVSVLRSGVAEPADELVEDDPMEFVDGCRFRDPERDGLGLWPILVRVVLEIDADRISGEEPAAPGQALASRFAASAATAATIRNSSSVARVHRCSRPSGVCCRHAGSVLN